MPPTVNVYNAKNAVVVAILGVLASLLSAYGTGHIPVGVMSSLYALLIATAGLTTVVTKTLADNLDPTKPATMVVVPSIPPPPLPPSKPKSVPPLAMLMLVLLATGCSASADKGVASFAIGLPCGVMLAGAILYWVSDKPKVSTLALYAFVVGLFWTLAGAVGHAGRFLGIVAVGVALAVSMQACKDPASPANITNGILDLEQTACVILQSELGQSEPALIETVCKVDPALITQVVQLLSAHKKAKLSLAKMNAAHPPPPPPCPTGVTTAPDGGVK